MELVLPNQELSEATRRVLRAALRALRVNRLPCPESAGQVVQDLTAGAYFGGLAGSSQQAAGEGDDPRSRWPALVRVSTSSFQADQCRPRAVPGSAWMPIATQA